MTADRVRVDRRFCGPPGIANGGYVAGLIAERVRGPLRVTLRRPVPVEQDLELVSVGGGRFELRLGAGLLAEAEPADLHVEVPALVDYQQAEAASDLFPSFQSFQFSGCFVCGGGRAPHDGLRIQPGPVAAATKEGVISAAVAGATATMVAAPWVPVMSLAMDSEVVPARFMWAALDCVGAYALHASGVEDGALVLGRIEARVISTLGVGERCTVVGWPLGGDGKRYHAGTALLTELGWPAAVSRQTWFPARGKVPGA